MRNLAGAVASIWVFSGSLWGQDDCHRYDASFGTLPSDQGWERISDDPATFEVDGGVLSQSTLPFNVITGCSNLSQPQQMRWQIAGEDFHFNDGLVFEAEIHIQSSQDMVTPCLSHPRPGFSMMVRDSSFRSAHLGILSSKLILFTDALMPVGSPGYSEIPFPTTDGFHVYRMEVDSTGIRVFVDGLLRLTESLGSSGSNSSIVIIGDSTGAANSAADLRWFRFHSGSSTWCDRGFANPGTYGNPSLVGVGDLIPTSPVDFTLSNALENRQTLLVIGFSNLTAPYKGGFLVPFPDVIVPGLATDSSGKLQLASGWPNIPAGIGTYWQFLVSDPGAGRGVALSNCLLAIAQSP